MSLILVFRNISNLQECSDYDVQVLVGDGGPLSNIISTGKVINHNRSNGWQALVQAYLDSHQDDGDGFKGAPSR